MSDSPSLRRWYGQSLDEIEDFGDYTDEEIQGALVDFADSKKRPQDPAERTRAITEDNEFFGKFYDSSESSLVDSLVDNEKINKVSRRSRIIGKVVDRVVRERLFSPVDPDSDVGNSIVEDAALGVEDIKSINRSNRRLANRIRSSVRLRGTSLIARSLDDDELLDDYLSVQRKKGSQYFLGIQDLTEEVNRRGLV